MPPTDLRVSAFGKNFITLVWKAPAHSLTSNFSVEISSSFWDTNSDYPVNTTSFTLEGLKSGTNYSLKVRTLADEEPSSPVNLTHFTSKNSKHIFREERVSDFTLIVNSFVIENGKGWIYSKFTPHFVHTDKIVVNSQVKIFTYYLKILTF